MHELRFGTPLAPKLHIASIRTKTHSSCFQKIHTLSRDSLPQPRGQYLYIMRRESVTYHHYKRASRSITTRRLLYRRSLSLSSRGNHDSARLYTTPNAHARPLPRWHYTRALPYLSLSLSLSLQRARLAARLAVSSSSFALGSFGRIVLTRRRRLSISATVLHNPSEPLSLPSRRVPFECVAQRRVFPSRG